MNKKDIVVLGIETSCDETSAAIVVDGRKVLSNIISSQIELHKKYGGVVPEVASRRHVELIIPVVDECLQTAGIEKERIDAIAVTCGPGLVGALLIGVSAAKVLSFSLDRPLIGVHHIEGHICANYITHENLTPPFMCLVASGGHSHIIFVRDYTQYEIIGRTRDDAAGEAFDKVARVLGLGYPGGPLIDKLARKGRKDAVYFPRTNFGEGNFDFSFSGIKTAVLNHINREKSRGAEIVMEDIAASFQQAVVEVLTENLMKAALKFGVEKVALAGGVSANSELRNRVEWAAQVNQLKFYYPMMELCTDNAAMIAAAGYFKYNELRFTGLDLNAIPNMKIGEK